LIHGSLNSVPKQGATVIVANHPLSCDASTLILHSIML